MDQTPFAVRCNGASSVAPSHIFQGRKILSSVLFSVNSVYYKALVKSLNPSSKEEAETTILHLKFPLLIQVCSESLSTICSWSPTANTVPGTQDICCSLGRPEMKEKKQSKLNMMFWVSLHLRFSKTRQLVCNPSWTTVFFFTYFLLPVKQRGHS